MNNTIIKYFLLAVLGIAFALIVVLMYLLGERDWLIRKKLRIGALIITLNGVVVGAGCTSSCYKIALDDAGVDEGLDSVGEIGTDADSDADTDVDTDADTDIDTDSDSDTDTETNTQAADAGDDSDTHTGTDLASDAGSDTGFRATF